MTLQLGWSLLTDLSSLDASVDPAPFCLLKAARGAADPGFSYGSMLT